jgi:hypothetical protein
MKDRGHMLHNLVSLCIDPRCNKEVFFEVMCGFCSQIDLHG